MKKMNNKGFSLIELIIVIAIMAILVAIIAPNLTKYLGKSKKSTDKKNADEITDVKGTDTVTGGSVSLDTSKPHGTGATNFEGVVSNALDSDTNTKSKVDSSKTSIEVVVSGSDSAGYTITAQFK